MRQGRLRALGRFGLVVVSVLSTAAWALVASADATGPPPPPPPPAFGAYAQATYPVSVNCNGVVGDGQQCGPWQIFTATTANPWDGIDIYYANDNSGGFDASCTANWSDITDGSPHIGWDAYRPLGGPSIGYANAQEIRWSFHDPGAHTVGMALFGGPNCSFASYKGTVTITVYGAGGGVQQCSGFCALTKPASQDLSGTFGTDAYATNLFLGLFQWAAKLGIAAVGFTEEGAVLTPVKWIARGIFGAEKLDQWFQFDPPRNDYCTFTAPAPPSVPRAKAHGIAQRVAKVAHSLDVNEAWIQALTSPVILSIERYDGAAAAGASADQCASRQAALIRSYGGELVSRLRDDAVLRQRFASSLRGLPRIRLSALQSQRLMLSLRRTHASPQWVATVRRSLPDLPNPRSVLLDPSLSGAQTVEADVLSQMLSELPAP